MKEIVSIMVMMCLISGASTIYAKDTGGGATNGRVSTASVSCLCTDTMDTCFARGNGSNFQYITWNSATQAVYIWTSLVAVYGAAQGYYGSRYAIATGVADNNNGFLGTNTLTLAGGVANFNLACNNPRLVRPVVVTS